MNINFYALSGFIIRFGCFNFLKNMTLDLYEHICFPI